MTDSVPLISHVHVCLDGQISGMPTYPSSTTTDFFRTISPVTIVPSYIPLYTHDKIVLNDYILPYKIFSQFYRSSKSQNHWLTYQQNDFPLRGLLPNSQILTLLPTVIFFWFYILYMSFLATSTPPVFSLHLLCISENS